MVVLALNAGDDAFAIGDDSVAARRVLGVAERAPPTAAS